MRFLLIVSPGFCFVPDAQIFAVIFIPADFRISPIELKTPGDCLQITLNGNGVVQAVTIAASLPLRSASGIPCFDSPIKRKTLRSKSDFKPPVMLPHQHGEATTRKSALAIFSPATSASSPAKTHFPQNNSQNRERNSKCGNPCKGKEFFCADENSCRRKNNLRHDDNRTYSYDRKMFFIFFHLKTPIKRQKTSTVFYRISTRFFWKLQGSLQFFPQDFLRL